MAPPGGLEGASPVAPAPSNEAARHRTSPEHGDASCVAAFDSLRATFERDYPGYSEKVAGRERALSALSDSVRAEAARSDDHAVCVPALWRWTALFQDPHVMLWQAAPPAPPGGDVGHAAPEATPSDDPLRPSLRFADDGTAVLRLPSFEMDYRGAIDSLVAASRARLLTTPTLIVDVRENGGGYTGSFSAVLPLLASGPIVRPGVDVWTSAANVAHLRGYLTAAGVPEALRTQIRSVLPAMDARPDPFVPFVPDEEVSFGEILPLPRAVAVLVDGGCASSCENFVLDARQSRKVAVYGAENTRGMVDYGNVRAVWLPGWRRLRIPTSRSRRLPAEPLDGVGIPPDVRVPAGETDAVAFVRCHLQTGTGCHAP